MICPIFAPSLVATAAAVEAQARTNSAIDTDGAVIATRARAGGVGGGARSPGACRTQGGACRPPGTLPNPRSADTQEPHEKRQNNEWGGP